MKPEELIGYYIRIKHMNGGEEENFKFKIGDVLKVEKCTDNETGSWTITFKDKPYGWIGRLKEHFEIAYYPIEWYKDKWIEITQRVGHNFVLGERYQIKECLSIYENSRFIFHNAPDKLWNSTSFCIFPKHYKIVEAPVKDCTAESTMSEEAQKILEQAKRRYPVGVEVVNLKGSDTFIVRNGCFLYTTPDRIGKAEQIIVIDGEPTDGNYLYADGKWAEYSETGVQFLIKKAEKHYPKGTKYIPTSRTSRETDESSGCFKWDKNFRRIVDAANITGIFEPKAAKWAEIVEIAKQQQEESVLEKAIREYPVGSYYYPLYYNGEPHPVYKKLEIVHHTPYCTSNGYIDGGIGYIYANGKWAEKPIEKPIEKTEDELLETAIKKYPFGTLVQPINLYGEPLGNPITVTYTPTYHNEKDKTIKATNNGLVYANGIWAAILDKEYLLEKAKERYPKGTYYNSADDGLKAKVKGDFYYFRSTSAISDSQGGFVYYKGKWAEIILPPVDKEEAKWPVSPNVALEFNPHSPKTKTSPESKISYIANLNVKLVKPAGKKRIKQL